MSLLRKTWEDAVAAIGRSDDLPPFHPATIVCKWGNVPISLQDLRSGVCITGNTGSGKTSTAIHLILSLLEADLGFCVMTVKPEEAALWRRLIAQAGRQHDLIEVDTSGRWRFNFLAEEAARPGSEGGGLTIALTALLMQVVEAVSGGTDGDQSGRDDQRFWSDALRHLLMNAIDLMQLARISVDLRILRELVASAPQSAEQAASENWRQGSMCYRAIVAAAGFAEREGDEATRVNVEECATFFLTDWSNLNNRTRSTIVTMLGMAIRPLLTRPLYTIFSTDTNVRPSDAADGKILLINIPVQLFNEVGVCSGIIWKYAMQRFIMRRSEKSDGKYLRPIVIYSDEAQRFISSHDYSYQAVARSGSGITCYIFQDRDALIANVGNAHKIDSLLSNLQLKLFCQATGPTAQWASELIGEHYVRVAGSSVGRNSFDNGAHAGVNVSEERRPYFDAARFGQLRRGGPQNGFLVDAVLYQGGRLFDDNLPFQIVTFDQS